MAQVLCHHLNYLNYLTYSAYLHNYLSNLTYWNNLTHFCTWLESVGSRALYELDPKKPVLDVVSVETILGKLPVPPGQWSLLEILEPHGMSGQFPGALANRTPGTRDGCPVWYVNSWALGWSRET